MNWFLSSEIENGIPEDSLFHIIPVPFEESVSYGTGTARGPQAIIDASSQLELSQRSIDPAGRGIHTLDPVVKRHEESIPEYLKRLEGVHHRILTQGNIPIQVGGEHTVTFAAVEACSRVFGEIGVIQFDAHADLRKTYEGSRFSHACVMRRICDELHLPILEVGIRAYSVEESRFIDEYNIPVITGSEADAQGLRELILPDDFPEHVFITFDVDGLDPSIMPATGTPVPGGLQWYQTLDMIESVAQQRRIVSFDIVELAPIHGLHHCDFTAAQLMYHIMSLITLQQRP